jgi:hypothetical protein
VILNPSDSGGGSPPTCFAVCHRSPSSPVCRAAVVTHGKSAKGRAGLGDRRRWEGKHVTAETFSFPEFEAPVVVCVALQVESMLTTIFLTFVVAI